jgi:hypothetical protein
MAEECTVFPGSDQATNGGACTARNHVRLALLSVPHHRYHQRSNTWLRPGVNPRANRDQYISSAHLKTPCQPRKDFHLSPFALDVLLPV